jgi:tRNA 2-thiouridine synthesizing protein A
MNRSIDDHIERDTIARMSGNGRAGWTYSAKLDARGLRCPLPVLQARKHMLALEDGQRLLVEATDPMAAIDFPHFCSEAVHRLVATETDGSILRFLIERA